MTAMRTGAFVAASLLLGAVSARADAALKPYGFVRFDAILNDSPMNHPQFPMWVNSEIDLEDGPSGVAKDKGEISFHPRLTRVGVDLVKTTIGESASIAGKIEIDFQNGGRESRETPRMRHGYLTITNGTFEVLAGQTWDLVSPLYPYVNHDGLMWNAGNTGDRRPQVRFTSTRPAGEGKMRVAAAFGMPNAVDGQDLDGNGVLDGAYAMVPSTQGLLEFSSSKITFGVWGEFHRERLVATDSSSVSENDYDAMLFGAHLKAPLGSQLTLVAEAFSGKNADDLRGGIGQGLNLGLDREIATQGGFAELQFQANPNWTFAAGATLDDPDDDDLSNGGRALNQVIYGAARLKTLERVQVGLEYLHWKTEYKNAADGDANRIDLWASLGF
ncbi:MAG: hypothetical protein R3B81_13010 [bacterium]